MNKLTSYLFRGTVFFCIGLFGNIGIAAESPAENVDWSVYRGDSKANQYSGLAQIDTSNVQKLQPVWEYYTKDATPVSTMYVNPLVIGGVMYITTPSLKVVALGAVTGKEIWSFDPSKYNEGAVLTLRSRGLAYWKGAEGERIFYSVKDKVYALDARTGNLVESFGTNGFIDLRQNLGMDPARVSIEMTSPGAIYNNLLILGSNVGESYDAAPGHIRAYNTVTGELEWIFHTIPKKGEFGYDTWNWVEGENYGGANAWSGITIDQQRGLVFAATGSATDDFYGGFRKGNNLFANSVLALDANTGVRKWHFQTVHHDIWDYDNPASPILVTINKESTKQDAVVQVTKMGLIFVLDRDTGKPLFPVQELPVPKSDVPGEETSPTQPFPTKPLPLVRLSLSESDLTKITPESHAFALEEFKKYKSGPIYTPPSTQGTINMPGPTGGAEWSGASFDPDGNVLYINTNELPLISTLWPVYDATQDETLSSEQLGRQIYERTCAACHGIKRKGYPPYIPSLVSVAKTDKEIQTIIQNGRSAMPAFTGLGADEIGALIAYLRVQPGAVDIGNKERAPDRYILSSYNFFMDQMGYPAIEPPWGMLNAIDLDTGDLIWQVPLGEYPELVAKGIRNTGTENYGGAVSTAGGLVFIAATADQKIRAFDKKSGELLWEYQLPANGYATPSVYMVNGRQFVVIAAGGGKGTKTGDAVIAFALPET